MRVARNALWLSCCRIAADVLSFIFFAALSRTFGPTGIGEYSYAFAIGGFVALLATSGYEEFGIRQYVQLSGERRVEAWRSLVLAQLVQLTLVLAATCGYLLLVSSHHARTSIMLELSIFLTGWCLSRTLFVPALAAESMTWPALSELGCRTAPILFALVLLLFTTAPSLPLLLLGFPVGAGVLVWIGMRSAAGYGAPFIPNGDGLAALRVAWGTAPFAASETLNQFYARTDLLLIAELLGTSSVGLYATGIKFIETGIVPLVLVGTAAYPVLSYNAGRRSEQFVDMSRDFLRTILFLSGWLAVGVGFVVPWVIVPVFGGDFAGTRAYLPWFAMLALVKGGEVALYRLLYSVRRQGSYLLSLCVGTALMVALNFMLIPRFGMLGAVIAAIASVTAVDCICASALRHEVRPRVLVPLLLRLGLALAGCAALTLLAEETLGTGWWIAVVAAVSFPVFGLLAGLLPHPRRSLLFRQGAAADAVPQDGAPSGTAMSIRLVTTEEEFTALKEGWQELQAANPNHTPFQSWEWNFAWWRHFGTPGRLRLFVVEADGRLIGVAPLFLAARYLGWPLRHLAFIARKRADYLDFVIRPGHERQFFEELCPRLSAGSRDWHFIDVRDFSETSANLPHFLRAASMSFPHVSVQPAESCVAVQLVEPWETFFATLGKNARRNVGRYRRHLEADYAIELKIPVTEEERQRCFADFVALYRNLREAQDGAPVFGSESAVAFEEEICRLGAAAGWFRLYLLYAAGRPVSGFLGYAWNRKFYAGLMAREPAFDKYSIGMTLSGLVIQDCIANHWTEIDFMRGDEGFKYQWGGARKHNYHLKLCSSRWVMTRTYLAEWLYQGLLRLKGLKRLRAAFAKRRRAAPPEVGAAAQA